VDAATPARRPAGLVFIWITVALDVLAIGVIIPVLPHLIKQFVGGSTEQAAFWVGVFGSVFALSQFVASPLQGALSDRFGRRPVVLLSNLGLGLDFVLMAVAGTLPLLFLGRVLAGITSASISTANAYIADITPAAQRAGAFGMLGAAFGIGFVIGPALGGVLGEIDVRLPFWVAAGLSLANFLYGFFVLPESLPRERRSARFDFKRANPFGAFRLLMEARGVLGLAGVVFLSQLAHYVLPSVYVLYTDYRYGWSELEVGLALGLVGVSNALVQALLVRRLVPRIGERRAVAIGLACGIAGFAWMGLAPSGPLFLLAVPLMALWGLAGPATQSLVTQRVDAGLQGRLQGALTSMVATAGIFGPFLFTSIFRLFIGEDPPAYLPGAAFLFSALLLAAAWALAHRATRALAD
jgi:DHA1 family tetracycline resistance protein-like MFS transporter